VSAEHPRDLPLSILNRLANRCKTTGDDPHSTQTRFILERFLYRLSQTRHRDSFVLKGAMLFVIWQDHPYRATRDLDLLGRTVLSPERLAAVVDDICSVPTEPDGVVFHTETIAVSPIRHDQGFEGQHVDLQATLGAARYRVRVDIGFGDAVVPPAKLTEFPVLLDFSAPLILAYPPETSIAEKVEAMLDRGMQNSRMKDLHDVCTLSRVFAFAGSTLSEALVATRRQRADSFPEQLPAPLREEFALDPVKLTQWSAFVRKSRVDPVELGEVVAALRRFLAEPYLAAARGEPFVRHWPAGGPWD
jgi:Nucleotidyl transferase AbiEii toxin, Type IV TA system